jgi:lysyl-tRNA synthetase class 2
VRVPAPGVDLHLDAIRADGGYLITSPEFHMKRLLVGGLPRIFQLSHASRADEHGPLHEPEFAMLEWYRAFASFEDVLADTEHIVSRVAKSLRKKAELTTPQGAKIEAKPPFDRITVRSAFKKYAGISDASELAESDESRFFELMVSKVEPALASYKRPVFLHEYPISQAALSRPKPRDPSVAERFELYAGGVELCNGYGELTDASEQRRRMLADQRTRAHAERPIYPIDERFILALDEGMPPSGGNALGFDRLIMLAVGASNIAEVLAFPAQNA